MFAIAVNPPPPGVAVLACRCGVVLDLADLQRSGAGEHPNGDPLLGQIVCAACVNRSW